MAAEVLQWLLLLLLLLLGDAEPISGRSLLAGGGADQHASCCQCVKSTILPRWRINSAVPRHVLLLVLAGPHHHHQWPALGPVTPARYKCAARQSE